MGGDTGKEGGIGAGGGDPGLDVGLIREPGICVIDPAMAR